MEISQKTQENSHDLTEILHQKIRSLHEENNELKNQLEWFKQQFKLASQRQFGKSSEATESMNLSLFDEAMSDDKSDCSDGSNQSETITYTRKKKSVGRQFDVSKFPKEQKIYDLDESEKTCGCGLPLEEAGKDTSFQVDYIPETFKVIEHIALKYCCRPCDTIKSAKKPESAIPKCMATPCFVAEVITKKYEQHLPLYRQSKIFANQGANIPDNTLGNWVMRAAEALFPLRDASKKQIPHVHMMQADETKIKTIKPNKEGYFWGYHSCDPGNRFILFEYSPSRAALVPNTTLKDFSGILQTDGYSGYNDLRDKSSVINLGCWDHARRKFTDVIKVADKTKQGKASQLLLLINQLYDVERHTKEWAFPDRKDYRQEKAKPVLDLIYEEALNINAPPKSLLGVAITYLSNQWKFLIKYIDHGESPISNIWIENQIRPFALGRRNWLFSGTPESANKAALLYGTIQSCHLNNINAKAYLQYVLTQAPAMRRGDVDPTSLLPQFIDKSIF
jgi:transposase